MDNKEVTDAIEKIVSAMEEDFEEHISELRTRISEEILRFMAEKCEFYEENVEREIRRGDENGGRE
ncbi:MAG: hypothetical protein ACTSPB_18250 [Candidatus Thorarchaeota archaeon]